MDVNLINTPFNTGVKNEVITPLKATTDETADTEPKALVKAVEESDKAAKASQEQVGEESPEKLQEAVAELSDTMSLMKKGLTFKIDDTLGISVVNVMDMDSGEMIRQIPTEEALELAQKLFEVSGMLMKTEA
ncbi:flagellar protein FlaG [Shewanella benthica]|uniref:Flagellin FlaG n=1 Tax=Shewanella benthica KT99 TaxID=314608 RepID=A9DA49_9GAMM|nr:flagellar protein FlaG [Shewanella benthica]EDQ00703.1 flagellin FlaG [Shewanella benthica KT99]